ncbi:MAG: DUF1624 domain-containing protein [Flavisolibacter sp.]
MPIALQQELKEYHPAHLKRSAYRIESIDVLRGMVMVIMALDHTRDFFHFGANTENPLGIGTTTPALYFTRWITHLCAPIFVFLAGTSIYLQGMRKTKSELSSFLVKRGIWLILIEFFVMSFAFTFDIHFNFIVLQVIWAIGISMILLALFIRLPYAVILTTGLIIVFGHNILDKVEARHGEPFGFFWDLAHRGNFALYHLWGRHQLAILYAFLPWTGLLFLGYCLGKLFRPKVDPDYRRKTLLILGAACLVFFILLRYLNIYGDPRPWSTQHTAMYTFFSFMNINKYPPSLLYMAITIAPALLFLGLYENSKNWFTNIFVVYGRVPFFYYILHFYIIHTLCLLLFLTRKHSFADGLKDIPGDPFKFVIPGEGYHLWTVYLIWIGVVAVLYPLCKWYSNYKLTHKNWWLSYI